jgi:phosphatidylinositol-4-phosphate 3-kinase
LLPIVLLFNSPLLQLEYRLPLEFIQTKILEITVWSHDSLQENEFLGGVQLHLVNYDLRQELIKWFPLAHLPRA